MLTRQADGREMEEEYCNRNGGGVVQVDKEVRSEIIYVYDAIFIKDALIV